MLNKLAEPTFPRTFDKSIEQIPNENTKATQENPYVPSAIQKGTDISSTNRLASRPNFGISKGPAIGRPQEQKLVANSGISQPLLPRNENKSTRNRIADPFAQPERRVHDYGSQEAASVT